MTHAVKSRTAHETQNVLPIFSSSKCKYRGSELSFLYTVTVAETNNISPYVLARTTEQISSLSSRFDHTLTFNDQDMHLIGVIWLQGILVDPDLVENWRKWQVCTCTNTNLGVSREKSGYEPWQCLRSRSHAQQWAWSYSNLSIYTRSLSPYSVSFSLNVTWWGTDIYTSSRS